MYYFKSDIKSQNRFFESTLRLVLIFGKISRKGFSHSTDILQPEDPGFKPLTGVFLREVFMFSLCMCGFSQCSSESPKKMTLSLTFLSKSPLCIHLMTVWGHRNPKQLILKRCHSQTVVHAFITSCFHYPLLIPYLMHISNSYRMLQPDLADSDWH